MANFSKGMGKKIKELYEKVNNENFAPAIPEYILKLEYQKLKDLKKEGDAAVSKLRGGFGSFGGNHDDAFNNTKGSVEKFVGNVNAYIEDNPDVKSKMRNLIKKIEKEINNLKSSNIITSNIDFRKSEKTIDYRNIITVKDYSKKCDEVLKGIKEFKKEHGKTDTKFNKEKFKSEKEKLLGNYQKSIIAFTTELAKIKTYFKECSYNGDKKYAPDAIEKDLFEYIEKLNRKHGFDLLVFTNTSEDFTITDKKITIFDYQDDKSRYKELFKNKFNKVVGKPEDEENTDGTFCGLYIALKKAEEDRDKFNQEDLESIKNGAVVYKDFVKEISKICDQFSLAGEQFYQLEKQNKDFALKLKKQNIPNLKSAKDICDKAESIKSEFKSLKFYSEYERAAREKYQGKNLVNVLYNAKLRLEFSLKDIDSFVNVFKNSGSSYNDLYESIKSIDDAKDKMVESNKYVKSETASNVKQNFENFKDLDNSIYNLYKRVKNSQKDLDGHTKKILALLYQYKKDNTRFKKILRFIVKKLFVNLARIMSVASIAESAATGNYIGAMNSATNMLMNITGDYLSTDLTRNLYK